MTVHLWPSCIDLDNVLVRSNPVFLELEAVKDAASLNGCLVFFPVDEEYGDSEPKKVRTAPREPKNKRSKNSQDDR